MSRHGSPTPNWLKAWYALLIFLAFVVVISLLLHKGAS